jgi:hypothetical protein
VVHDGCFLPRLDVLRSCVLKKGGRLGALLQMNCALCPCECARVTRGARRRTAAGWATRSVGSLSRTSVGCRTLGLTLRRTSRCGTSITPQGSLLTTLGHDTASARPRGPRASWIAGTWQARSSRRHRWLSFGFPRERGTCLPPQRAQREHRYAPDAVCNHLPNVAQQPSGVLIVPFSLPPTSIYTTSQLFKVSNEREKTVGTRQALGCQEWCLALRHVESHNVVALQRNTDRSGTSLDSVRP